MSLNAFNSSLQNTSWSATATDLYTGSTVSYNNFSVSPLDEIEKNFTAAIEKFSNLTEVDYTTEEDGFTTESLLQKIKNVTTSIINTISSTVPSTIIDTTTEDKAIAFLSTTGTQKTFSEDLSTEEGSGTDQISTVQTEEESTTIQSTTAFQSSSNEDISTVDKVSRTTTQTSSTQPEEENTTIQSTTAFQSSSSEDISTVDKVSTTTTQTSSTQPEEESTIIQSTTAFQSSSSEDVGTEDGVTTQNTTERVTTAPPTKNSITTPVIAILTGAASVLAAIVACVYYKTKKPSTVTVLPRQDQDQDVEMSLLKKN
ncbi:MAG: hypothetical protein ACRCU0_05680 [Candidatus Rhabdochlamydia sp.]